MNNIRWWNKIWAGVRRMSGDDAYERYLAHWQEHHAQEGEQPMDRIAYFKAEQARKWEGVRRCC